MKINLDGIKVKTTSGIDIFEDGKPLFIKEQIASILATDTDPSRNGLKLLELARKFDIEGEIDIDKADIKLVLEVVKSRPVSALIRGEIEEILDKVD